MPSLTDPQKMPTKATAAKGAKKRRTTAARPPPKAHAKALVSEQDEEHAGLPALQKIDKKVSEEAKENSLDQQARRDNEAWISAQLATQSIRNARRSSRASGASEEILLNAINEATERTRLNAQKDFEIVLKKQAEMFQEQKEEAVRKAVDEALTLVQERAKAGEEEQERSGGGKSNKELKALKSRCRDLQDQTKRLNHQVEMHRKAAADAVEDAKKAQANEEKLMQKTQQLKAELSGKPTRRAGDKKQKEVRVDAKNMQGRAAQIQAKRTQSVVFMQEKRKSLIPEADSLLSETITTSIKEIKERPLTPDEMIRALAVENDILQKRLQEQEAEHEEEVKQKMRELQDALSMQDMSTAEASAELSRVKAQLSGKEQELSKAEGKVKTLEVQLKEIDSINWELEREVRQVTQKLKGMEGELSSTKGSLEETTTKYNVSESKRRELEQAAEKLDPAALEKLQALVNAEKHRRIEMENDAKRNADEAQKLQSNLSEVQRDCEELKQLAQSESRKCMMAGFSENSVKKQLEAMKKDLQHTQEMLAKAELAAKESLEREKKKVNKIQRELASTKEMLRASQRAHKKAPSPKKHKNSPMDVYMDVLQTNEAFGRPREISTNLNPLRKQDWIGADINEFEWPAPDADSAEVIDEDDDCVWKAALDPVIDSKVDSESGSPCAASPIAEMDHETAINEAINTELSKALGEKVTLPPI